MPAENRLRWYQRLPNYILRARWKDIEEHKEDASAGHETDLVPIRVLDMSSVFVKCDPAVLHDKFSHANNWTMNFSVLEDKVIHSPVRLLVLEMDLTLIGYQLAGGHFVL